MSELAQIPAPPPGSCSPRAFGRLLSLIAQGHTAPSELGRRLKVEPSELSARLDVAAWLGFVHPGSPSGDEPSWVLSRRGLEYVYARRRPRVYAEVLWDHPVVGAVLGLLAGAHAQPGQLPVLLPQLAPHLSPDQLERAAASLGAIVRPALRQRPRRRERRPGTQLRLAFARPRAPVTGYRFRVSPAEPAAPDCVDPAVYRTILQALLDEGELPIAQLASVVGKLGLEGVVLGPYAELAVRRGDAERRVDGRLDQLVVTPGAIERADVSDTVASVALSDPDYREYLGVLQATGQGDLGAAARYGRLRARFRCWDQRIFGEELSPRDMARAAQSLIEGRTLAAIPVAEPAASIDYLQRPAPFLDQLSSANLLVSLPPSIDLLVGGLPAVKRCLEAAWAAPAGIHQAFAPRLMVHGGLLHPGEPLPTSIPDGVSLRLHAIERVPHLAVLVAIMLQQREGQGRIGLRMRGERLRVYHRRRDLGSFLLRADDLMRERGWLVCRRQRGGLLEASLKDIVECLGIGVQAGRSFVLQEAFFQRLRRQPEDRHLHDRLRPLGAWIQDRLEEWAVAVEPDTP
jgi:hypothetical protein